MLFVETPTNPVMRLTDLARRRGDRPQARDVRMVVDNTFASPYVQRPLELGADLVVHSTTKYLNGHSDSIGGIVIATRDDDIEWLRLRPERRRGHPQPVRLVARAARHQDARRAHGAAQHQRAWRSPSSWPRTRRSQQVLYPGLPTIRSTSWRKRQMNGFGGMLSFDVGTLREGAARAATASG